MRTLNSQRSAVGTDWLCITHLHRQNKDAITSLLVDGRIAHKICIVRCMRRSQSNYASRTPSLNYCRIASGQAAPHHRLVPRISRLSRYRHIDNS